MFGFHWQNLQKSEKEFPWHGRAWLYCGRPTLNIEWNIGKPDFRLEFGVDCEGINFSFALPGLSLHWGVDNLPGWNYGMDRWSSCIYWFECALWFALWHNDYESCSDDPWWKKMYSIHFDDLFLGKQKYSKQVLETYKVKIPLPEGSFEGIVEMEECTWKRPRWFANVRRYATIICDNPPKFPGKGENSWDCGDDHIYQMSTRATTVSEAVAAYVKSVLEYREKRGGRRTFMEKVETK